MQYTLYAHALRKGLPFIQLLINRTSGPFYLKDLLAGMLQVGVLCIHLDMSLLIQITLCHTTSP